MCVCVCVCVCVCESLSLSQEEEFIDKTEIKKVRRVRNAPARVRNLQFFQYTYRVMARERERERERELDRYTHRDRRRLVGLEGLHPATITCRASCVGECLPLCYTLTSVSHIRHL